MTRARRAPRGIAWHNAKATHCLRGHPFDDANTFRWTDVDGGQHRQCRECNRIRSRKHTRERCTRAADQ